MPDANSATRDSNRVVALLGQDSSTGKSIPAIIDHATNGLNVNIVGGSTSGTQYTNGGVPPANPIGTMPIWNNAGTWTQTQLSSGLPIQPSTGATFPVSGTFWQATQPVSLASLPALATGANTIGALIANQSMNVAQINGVAPLMGNGVSGTGALRVALTSDGTLGTVTTVSTVTAVTAITNALPAGTNLMGKVGIDQTTLGTTNAVTPVPASNSGWSFSYQSALTNTAVQIKGTAGTFGGYLWLYNPNTAVTYIQIFNKASASVTLGTTAPDYVIALPGIAAASATGSAANMEMVHGIKMGTGITVAATTTATGSTAPANALVCTFLFL